MHGQLRQLRRGLDWQLFRVIIPNQNLPVLVNPADSEVELMGFVAMNGAAAQFTIGDGDQGMQLTFNVAATNLPTPLWSLVFYRGIYVVACNNPVLVWGKERR